MPTYRLPITRKVWDTPNMSFPVPIYPDVNGLVNQKEHEQPLCICRTECELLVLVRQINTANVAVKSCCGKYCFHICVF